MDAGRCGVCVPLAVSGCETRVAYALRHEYRIQERHAHGCSFWGCLAALLFPWIRTRLRAWGHSSIGLLPGLLFFLVIPFRSLWASLLEAILFPALLVCTATFPDSRAGRILESPALRWIGRLSYSIYIWQQLAMFPESNPHSPLLLCSISRSISL